MDMSDGEKKLLADFGKLNDEQKLAALQKLQSYGWSAPAGEVKFGAAAPDVVPPSGDVDPETRQAIESAPEKGEKDAPHKVTSKKHQAYGG